MTERYVLSSWYVVATAEEVGAAPLRRVLMDDAVVLYRSSDGHVVALRDRCVHCGAALSRGTLVEQGIACPYHGLVYDAAGACVLVPSQEHVPDGVRVRSFPTYDDGTFVWIWPGRRPGGATLSTPPRLPFADDPSWARFGGSMTVDANYVLLHEHLLDITHFWIGMPAASPATLRELAPLGKVRVTETSVDYRRSHPPTALAEWESQATGMPTTAHCAHRDSATFVSPGLQLMSWDIDAGDGTVYEHVVVRALTPETDARTRVSWVTAFGYADRRPQAIHTLRTVVADTLQQDATMVEMVQANLGPAGVSSTTGRAAGAVSLLADTAALKATRIIRELLAREG